MPLQYTDVVACREDVGAAHTEKFKDIDTLRRVMLAPPASWQEVKVDITLDMSTSGSNKYLNAMTVPAGAIIKYVFMHILADIVASGTTVKASLNAHSSVGTGDYILLATLTKNTKKAALVADATPLAAPLALDVNGVTSAGTALGSGNVTAGTVRVVVTYFIPDVPADV